MIKRTIEISREAAHLTVRQKQLLIRRDGQTVGSIPCEDIGVVLVDHPGATYSHAALSSLAGSNATLVVCGRDHLPSAVLLPLSSHSQIVWRIKEQLAASKPLRKQLWKQLVQAKIRAQAYNLSTLPADSTPQVDRAAASAARSRLLELARQVRSGDPRNVEAQAARVYWDHFLPEEDFRRNRHADGLNAFLNYGYSVLRAAIARTLVAAGLMPAVGLHHCNRSNAFCLADDLIEPLRPLVDERARNLYLQGHEQLMPEAKAGLLSLLADPVELAGEQGPLMVHLHRMTASLVKCFQGAEKKLLIPTAVSNISPERRRAPRARSNIRGSAPESR